MSDDDVLSVQQAYSRGLRDGRELPRSVDHTAAVRERDEYWAREVEAMADAAWAKFSALVDAAHSGEGREDPDHQLQRASVYDFMAHDLRALVGRMRGGG